MMVTAGLHPPKAATAPVRQAAAERRAWPGLALVLCAPVISLRGQCQVSEDTGGHSIELFSLERTPGICRSGPWG